MAVRGQKPDHLSFPQCSPLSCGWSGRSAERGEALCWKGIGGRRGLKLASRKAVGSATWCAIFLGTPYVDYVVNEHLVEKCHGSSLEWCYPQGGTEGQGWNWEPGVVGLEDRGKLVEGVHRPEIKSLKVELFRGRQIWELSPLFSLGLKKWACYPCQAWLSTQFLTKGAATSCALLMAFYGG